MKHMISIFISTTAVMIAMILGCASVPKEVVELSYHTGEDIAALYDSYDLLIHDYYEKMRQERISYLDNTWYPQFLRNWMNDGRLIEIAKEEIVWAGSIFVEIVPESDPAESFRTLASWVDYALFAYEDKQDSLTKSLYAEEDSLRTDVREAFGNIMRANAAITAHLNSIREVKEVQDEALQALKIKGLRDSITARLIRASELATEELERVMEIDGYVDEAKKVMTTVKN